MSPESCVVLVPVGRVVEPACEEGLAALERRGYTVWREWGHSDISRGRSEMASRALAAGYEELMWIDSDVMFDPRDVDRLRAHSLPITAGLYPIKNERRFACVPAWPEQRVTFGEGGGLVSMHYLATGFLHTRAEVYRAIADSGELPRPDAGDLLPYFLPVADEDGRYLGEDYSWCERARRCGYLLFADTRIRLFHVGMRVFEWEDVIEEPPRHATYRFTFHRA